MSYFASMFIYLSRAGIGEGMLPKPLGRPWQLGMRCVVSHSGAPRWRLVASSASLRALDRTRKCWIAEANEDFEIHWGDIMQAARVPKMDHTRAAKCLRAAGFHISWRTPHLKQARGEIDEKQRARICSKLRKLTMTLWTDTIDAYIDGKM